MLSRLHSKLGTAGFIISIVALVAALGGGAYAASGGLSGKQKKEVEKIAKKSAGKPGAQGPAGTPGANGTAGALGKDGAEGKQGPEGKAGSSATVVSLNPGNAHCLEGGSEFKVGPGTPSYACNGEEGLEGPQGEEGSPWVDGGVLPPGQSETGTWLAGPYGGSLPAAVKASISFPIPVEGEPALTYVAAGSEPTAGCPGTVEDPQAAPGNLCVYELGGFGLEFREVIDPVSGESWAEEPANYKAGSSGSLLSFTVKQTAGQLYGNWVVSATEAP
jgi:hypothetical protein